MAIVILITVHVMGHETRWVSFSSLIWLSQATHDSKLVAEICLRSIGIDPSLYYMHNQALLTYCVENNLSYFQSIIDDIPAAIRLIPVDQQYVALPH
jgi:hypothetical protein